VRTITDGERRARLTRRHFLSPDARANSFVELAGGLVGLHASDPASVYLAAHARLADPSVAEIERALYEERTVLRMIGMRRTMFVVPLDLAAVVRAACTNAIAAAQRRRYAKLMEEGGIARDGAAWLDDAGRDALAALEARGQAFAAELSADVPRLREKLTYGEGTSWAGSQSMTTWVLFLLAAEGRIARGRPRGAWTGSQWSWVPASSWLDATLTEPDADTARAELVRRWLRVFGPGTLTDLRWWTGLTTGQVKAALAAVDTVEVSLGQGRGLVLGDDDEPVDEPEPSAALLPALDPTTMGWKERDWYLGAHGATLFDTNGNAGPTVWWDGRVVGGWMQRKDGEVVHGLLEDVGADARAAIDAQAERLAAWIGDVRVTPRFPTPFHRELAA
jgi:Winged helix DNA-binding domain